MNLLYPNGIPPRLLFQQNYLQSTSFIFILFLIIIAPFIVFNLLNLISVAICSRLEGQSWEYESCRTMDLYFVNICHLYFNYILIGQ